MSEAEVHLLRSRMYEGLLHKARRGEVYSHPPIGYGRAAGGGLELDPDGQVQGVVRLIFDQLDREATLHGLLRYLVHHHICLPVRLAGGPDKGQLEWRRPNRATLSNLLHNPTYAGAYRFGYRAVDPRRKRPGRPGTGRSVRRPEECLVLLRTACRRTSRGSGSRPIRRGWRPTATCRIRPVPPAPGRPCWPGWSAAGGAGDA